jgi:hypothetical protein
VDAAQTEAGLKHHAKNEENAAARLENTEKKPCSSIFFTFRSSLFNFFRTFDPKFCIELTKSVTKHS